MKLGEGVAPLEESKILRTLHPTLLHANRKGPISHFCVCRRSEKEFSILRGFGYGSWHEKEVESPLLLGVCKIYFSRVYSLGFGKREKIRKKLFSSPTFFHLFISSRSLFLTSRKILEIQKKDPDQSRRRSSRKLALLRRPIRLELRVDFP